MKTMKTEHNLVTGIQGEETKCSLCGLPWYKADKTPCVSTKLTKINKIKCWLQKYGKRDEDTFTFDGYLDDQPLHISLQYDYDEKR